MTVLFFHMLAGEKPPPVRKSEVYSVATKHNTTECPAIVSSHNGPIIILPLLIISASQGLPRAIPE